MASSIRNALRWVDLDDTVGEELLLHGTSHLEAIKEHGFNERFGSGVNMYGEGVYFTDQSCKAMQYTECNENDGSECIIVARVILGEPYYAREPCEGGTRIAPLREGNAVLHITVCTP